MGMPMGMGVDPMMMSNPQMMPYNLMNSGFYMNPYTMMGMQSGQNINSLIDKKEDNNKKDNNDDNKNKPKSNLLDIRAFTTNQDVLLRKPFRTEIVNPLNRKLHSRSITSMYNVQYNTNNTPADKNLSVMSTTTNANLINQLGSQPKIHSIKELSHYKQFDVIDENHNDTRSVTNCNMSIRTTSQMYNLTIKFLLRDNFDIIIETKPTEIIQKAISKFQDSLKQKLTGNFENYPQLKHL